MRRYIMEWDPEKRRVPLQKILDIFHELGQEEVKCYVLIKPQHKNVIEELKTREGLTFYWEEDLGLRGSIFYSHELMPAWIGGSLFSCWENMVRLVVGRTLFFVSH